MKIPPFTILALAPFSHMADGLSDAEMFAVDTGSLDEAVEKLAATLSIPVPKDLCPSGALTFKPSRMKDFRPEGVVRTIPFLKDLSDASEAMDRMAFEGRPAEEIAQYISVQWPGLSLNLAITENRTPHAEAGAVDDILSMVAMPGSASTGAGAGAGGVKAWKEQIDAVMGALLAAVFSDARFRSMEAAWQGVKTLVRQGPVKEGGGILLKIAPITENTIHTLLDQLTRQSSDAPPNLILMDQAFDNSSPSIELLEKVIDAASTLLVPTAVWLGPRFFHVQNWSQLSALGYLNHYLEDAAYAKWRKLKEGPGSEWLVMTANRFLTRDPYGDANLPRTAYFREQTPLWISPVWALGTLIAKSVTTYGWPTRFTDYRHISLDNLSVLPVEDEGAISTETVFSEDRILQFTEAGIIPLVGLLRKDSAIMPKEALLSGGSLKFQLFLNRIISFFFDLKEKMGAEVAQTDLEETLSAAFSALFDQTGHQPPVDLSIQPEPAGEGDSIPLRIAFTPPGSVLPTSERIEFTLSW